MTRDETAELLRRLSMVWPDRFDGRKAVDYEKTTDAYHIAWGDLPYELARDAVAEHLRTGKFFPAPAEIRELALRAGVGLPAAEIAWQEAQRVVGGHRAGDPPPRWASRVLEEAVNAVGWSAIKACEADSVGTLRAQFRDTYNALLKAAVADDARAALAEADGRRALLAFVPRPVPTLPPAPPVPVPEAAPSPAAAAPAEPWALRKFRERFAAKQSKAAPAPAAGAGLSKLSGAEYLRTLPAWNALPKERRERLLAEHAARKAAGQ